MLDFLRSTGVLEDAPKYFLFVFFVKVETLFGSGNDFIQTKICYNMNK
jgi:hypothetical protein